MLVYLSSLSQWERFPDGISLNHSQRIARAIGKLGTRVKVDLEAHTHEALEKAIKQAEQGKAIAF